MTTSGSFLLRNAVILPMEGTKVRHEPGSILVENGVITAVGAVDEIDRHPAAGRVDVVDGTGQVAIPGLHNCHLHSGLLRGTAAQGVGPRAAHNRAGPGLEFLDVRQYTPGDDLRHIDWRQSSRRGQPMVRRYRDESASDWFICIDGSASMGLADKWQMAVQLASALTYALIYGGHRVALAVFAERIHTYCPTGRGQLQYATVLRHLVN